MAHVTGIQAENLVLPLVVAVALACWGALTDRSAWQRLLLGPAVAVLYVTHNRFILMVPLVLLLLALTARAGVLARRLAVANGVLLLGLLALGQVIRTRLVEARWTRGIDTPQGPASAVTDVVTDLSVAGEYLLNLVGQLWYVAVGTVGLAALGVGVAIREVWAARPRSSDASRLTLAFLVASAAGVLAVSTYFFTRVETGGEGMMAGRHNDSFVPIWVAMGVGLVVARPPARVVGRRTAEAAAAVALLGGALLVTRGPAAFENLYTLLNVPAVFHLSSLGPWLVPVASAAALLALAGLAGTAAGRRTPLMVVVAAALWLTGSVAVEVQPDPLRTIADAPGRLDELLPEGAEVAVVQERNDGVPTYYQFFAPGLRAVPWDGEGVPPHPLVLARLDLPGLARSGARVAFLDHPPPIGFNARFELALWVLPGATQERWARRGSLLPVGYPVALPDAARRAELSLPGTDRAVEVGSGASASLAVTGRHVGSMAPWPGGDSAKAPPGGWWWRPGPRGRGRRRRRWWPPCLRGSSRASPSSPPSSCGPSTTWVARCPRAATPCASSSSRWAWVRSHRSPARRSPCSSWSADRQRLLISTTCR